MPPNHPKQLLKKESETKSSVPKSNSVAGESIIKKITIQRIVIKLFSCKPDSVPPYGSRYHLSGPAITDRIFLPTLRRWFLRTIGRAALNHRFTWHFSIQGLPPQPITGLRRRLLPYVFTFSPFARGSYFLWHYL